MLNELRYPRERQLVDRVGVYRRAAVFEALALALRLLLRAPAAATHGLVGAA